MLGALLKVAGPKIIGASSLKAFMAAFNHLLGQHPNAASRLAAHAGKRVRLGVDGSGLPGFLPRPEVWAIVTDEGRLESAREDEADVQLLLKPSVAAGQALASQGVGGLASHLRVEGDVLLAGLLGELIQELRWDYEDDLASVVGDPAARRVTDALKTGADKATDLASRVKEQASSVAREATSREDASTVAGQVFQSAKDGLSQLDDRLTAIEKKLRKRN
ncbi:MAG: SCP2 domain-containing protein [Burkholderiaceae bacterium]